MMTVFHLNIDQAQEEVLAAIQKNGKSQFVCVETKQQIVQRHEIMSLFQALSCIFFRLKKCFIKKVQALPAECLATLLMRQSNLEFLYLQNVTLFADQEGVRRLAQAFRLHQGLRKIRLYMSRPALGTNITLDPIVSAMASIPTLEEVALIHSSLVSSNDQRWEGKSLRDLCRSESLKVLTLTFATTSLKDEQIAMMADSLQSNNVLKKLSIRGSLGRVAGVALGRLLRGNSMLEQLRVQLDLNEHALPIIAAMHHNTNLKQLGLVLPRSVATSPDQKLITAKVVEMLRSGNHSLLNMDMGGLWRHNKAEICFFLKANQAGRQTLLGGGATRVQWMETLFANCDDLSIVYYFLGQNPSLSMVVLGNMMQLDPEAKICRKRNREQLSLLDNEQAPKEKMRRSG